MKFVYYEVPILVWWRNIEKFMLLKFEKNESKMQRRMFPILHERKKTELLANKFYFSIGKPTILKNYTLQFLVKKCGSFVGSEVKVGLNYILGQSRR